MQADHIENQQQHLEQQLRPEIERQRNEAQLEAEKALGTEAIAAIDETYKAINFIATKKNDEALAAIERASGKLNILVGRNPETSLIPVRVQIDVIDTAPMDSTTILEIAQDAARALDERNFPAARVLLYGLMSEIRIRTYNLPLATYPAALKGAARLLEQKNNKEASDLLLRALTTLVATDKVVPLPLVRAREAINQAYDQRERDKDAALSFLEKAKSDIERSRQLGYAGKDTAYAALNDQIEKLEKQLKNSEDTAPLFAKLKEKLAAFLKR